MNKPSVSPMKTDRSAFCGPCKKNIAVGEERYFHAFRRFVLCPDCANKEDEAPINSAPQQSSGPAATVEQNTILIEALLRKIVANELEPIYEAMVRLTERVQGLEERLYIRPAYSNMPVAPAKPVRKPFDADAFGQSLIDQATRPN